MKDVLINSIFNSLEENNFNSLTAGMIITVHRYSKILKFLRSSMLNNSSVVALVSNNVIIQSYFQLACLLTGTNYIIFNKENYDYYIVANIGINVIFTDEDIESNFDEYSPLVTIDTFSFRVIRHSKYYFEIAESITRFSNNLESFPLNSNKSIVELKGLFEDECIERFENSKVFVLHPGSSSIEPKISVFFEDQIYQGMLKVADDLYSSIKDSKFLTVKQENDLSIDVKILENTSPLYTLLNGVFLAVYSRGTVNNTIGTSTSNTLFSSSNFLNVKFNEIIEDSAILTWLNKFKIKLIFNLLFRKAFKKKYPGSKLLLLYGSTSKNFRKLVRATKLKIVYLYTMSEVASFVSFELHSKFPVKEIPTVGSIPKNVILNSSPGTTREMAEILIALPDRFAYYTHKEFTSLCSMSDKYVGMHSTFDIGSNKEGKLQVHGKADELFYNENGLVIQNEIIYSIILSSNLVKDALIITVEGKIVVIVELKTSTLLFENITIDQAAAKLRSKELKLINKTVKPFSKVSNIYIIPEFERVNHKIKISHYLLEEVIKNLD